MRYSVCCDVYCLLLLARNASISISISSPNTANICRDEGGNCFRNISLKSDVSVSLLLNCPNRFSNSVGLQSPSPHLLIVLHFQLL